MAFFNFSQNNSGGSFIFNKERGITCHVIIEANDANHANERAESIGLYFNGCEEGMDCECCGDRWSQIWRGDKGDEVPSIYGQPIVKRKPVFGIVRNKQGFETAVHYADGTIKLYSADGEELV